MAGKPGRSGTNKGQDKPWREALWKAVCELDGDEKKLVRIARAVVTAASTGDMQAAREIGDRLDGKPRQEIDATVEQTNYVVEIPALPKDSDTWAAQHAPKTIQ
jgi:hypothetical protein